MAYSEEERMRREVVRRLAIGGVIAALYLSLTLLFAPISFKAFQVRVSEALTLLPFFFPEAIFGLFVGCFFANFFSPFGIIDVIFGSSLTLIAAYFTYLIGKTKRLYLAPLPPILVNGFGVSFYITLLSKNNTLSLSNFDLRFYLSISFSIIIGEAVATYLIGLPLLYAIMKIPFLRRFKNEF